MVLELLIQIAVKFSNIMNNNTAEGSINVAYPYRIEVKIRDITGNE